ncbi:rhodanese-like domain-containing protein [Williamsia soli]|uniref:rhodanese-like domain-containing protein n=1 Tax=Williamsia soli TaxID=364929 RepID=UPI001A9E26F7|nr:rhodanese-like domain-containing protein [Williamsia soli]
MSEIPSVPVSELPDDFTGETSRLLLDVREHDEWESGHVAGALHIPLGDVPARIDEIDPDSELFVICHAGGRSERVLGYLIQRGYEGTNVSGGMAAWAGAGRPMQTGPGGSRGAAPDSGASL